MRDKSISETAGARRRATSRATSFLMLVIVAILVQGCQDSRVQVLDQVQEADSKERTEQRQLVDTLYLHGTSNARLFWWPDLADAPEDVVAAVERAGDLLALFPQAQVSAFSIGYSSNDFPQVSAWVRRTGNRQLLVYNHGHSGLPEPAEDFARQFLGLAIDSGFDLLIVSMPFTGLNTPIPGRVYQMRTRDLPELIPVDPAVILRFDHALYEAMDDADGYLRYFIDGVVLPVAHLHESSWRSDSVIPAGQGNVLPTPQLYDAVSYVGLSGGASTGLTVCGVLALRRCVLVAGVMPDDLRVKHARNFGDAEQQSRSIHQGFSTSQRLQVAAESTERLVLLFNQNDSCCFADPAATEFQLRYPQYDIRVRPLDFHGYEPGLVLSILD